MIGTKRAPTNVVTDPDGQVRLQLSKPRDLRGRRRSELYYHADSFHIRKSSSPFLTFHAFLYPSPIYSFYFVRPTT